MYVIDQYCPYTVFIFLRILCLYFDTTKYTFERKVQGGEKGMGIGASQESTPGGIVALHVRAAQIKEVFLIIVQLLYIKFSMNIRN